MAPGARGCVAVGEGWHWIEGLFSRTMRIGRDFCEPSLILELNARPGLNIQLANRRGLRTRLDAIEALGSRHELPARRVEWSRRTFGDAQAEQGSPATA